MPTPRSPRVREELVAAGRARPHHVLPASGRVSYWIEGAEDVPRVLEFFRLGY